LIALTYRAALQPELADGFEHLAAIAFGVFDVLNAGAAAIVMAPRIIALARHPINLKFQPLA
jgi:hypothetical protein